MKLTNKLLNKLVEEVLNEQPPQSPKQGGEEEPQEKPLKTDIPNSPFEPDVNQVRDELEKILHKWAKIKYPNDRVRWQDYYHDIEILFKKLKSEKEDEV